MPTQKKATRRRRKRNEKKASRLAALASLLKAWVTNVRHLTTYFFLFMGFGIPVFSASEVIRFVN